MKSFIKRIEKMAPYALFAYVSAIFVLALATPYLLEQNFSASSIANVVILGSFAWALLLFSAIGTFNGDDDEIAEYHRKIEREEENIKRLARKLERNNRKLNK